MHCSLWEDPLTHSRGRGALLWRVTQDQQGLCPYKSLCVSLCQRWEWTADISTMPETSQSNLPGPSRVPGRECKDTYTSIPVTAPDDTADVLQVSITPLREVLITLMNECNQHLPQQSTTHVMREDGCCPGPVYSPVSHSSHPHHLVMTRP